MEWCSLKRTGKQTLKAEGHLLGVDDMGASCYITRWLVTLEQCGVIEQLKVSSQSVSFTLCRHPFTLFQLANPLISHDLTWLWRSNLTPLAMSAIRLWMNSLQAPERSKINQETRPSLRVHLLTCYFTVVLSTHVFLKLIANLSSVE